MLLEMDAPIGLQALSSAIARRGGARDRRRRISCRGVRAAGAQRIPRRSPGRAGGHARPPDAPRRRRPRRSQRRPDLRRPRQRRLPDPELRHGRPGPAPRRHRRQGVASSASGTPTLPGDPLRIEAGHFAGRKSFASGRRRPLSHAIVTVSDPAGRQMYVVPTDALAVDRSWWRPLGMRASGSHVADFSGVRLDPDWKLGGGRTTISNSPGSRRGQSGFLPCRWAGCTRSSTPRPGISRHRACRQSLPGAPARAHGRRGRDRLSLARPRGARCWSEAAAEARTRPWGATCSPPQTAPAWRWRRRRSDRARGGGARDRRGGHDRAASVRAADARHAHLSAPAKPGRRRRGVRRGRRRRRLDPARASAATSARLDRAPARHPPGRYSS